MLLFFSSQLTSLTEEREQMIGRQREMEGYVSELQSKLGEEKQSHCSILQMYTIYVQHY